VVEDCFNKDDLKAEEYESLLVVSRIYFSSTMKLDAIESQA